MEEYTGIPIHIESLVKMSSPNESIPVYTGDFTLKRNEVLIKVRGKLVFKWFPEMRVEYSGEHLLANKNPFEAIDFISENNNTDLIIDGLLFGKGFITRVENNSNQAFIRGFIVGDSLLGDSTIPVSSIKFTVANLKGFNGSTTKTKINSESLSLNNSRLSFIANDYIINLDKITEFNSHKQLLEDDGGYIVLYAGEILNTRSSIKLFDIQEIIHCFSTFLSFLNGRRSSLILLTGLFEEETIWQDFTPRFTDQYKSVFSWTQHLSIDGLNSSWQYFYNLWQNENHKDFIKSSVHWYIEANSHAAFTEGSIVLTQTALELLYNWLIVEEKGILVGKDSENISASNKIRLLINTLNIPYNIPASLNNLQKFKNTNQDIADGPEAFVQIRNAIVHSQEEKRKKLMKISGSIKYEALKLGLWYLELALLYSFGFEGEYRNRCSDSKWAGSDEERVPWIK